jgi:tetratricopeptide (TPR) repeat protein
MAQEPPKPGARRRPSSILPTKLDELGSLLEQQFPDAAPILELLVTAQAKGQDSKQAWNQLHAAAVRHDKISELAFAYEHVLHEKRLRLLAPDTQAEVYLHAVRFFNDFFGDTDGAVSYAERALSAVPGHPEAFSVLETLLSESEQPLRLAKLYADASAVERDKDQQLVFLGRAAELVDGQPGADELMIEICQKTLRVEPRATATRLMLEQRLTAAGRVRDAARLLEQAVMLDPPLSGEEAGPLRERLIAMYVGELGDPKQSIAHVEALLAHDPTHELARQVAEALLENKAVAPRAIAALGDACERLGQLDRAAALLA